MEIEADYSWQYLLPPGIEDWVPANHPARFIRDFIKSLDMEGLGFKTRKVEQGRPNYSPKLLLAVWLYGYVEGIRSSRGLEKACMNQMGLIWLTGCNYPDHNTLWRFFRDNKDKLEEVFKKTVRVAQEVGLIGLVLHAVDGTKIPSVASNRQALHKENLTELPKVLDESIEKMMSEVEDREGKEAGEYRLSEELQDAEKRRTAVQEALNKLEKEYQDQPSSRGGSSSARETKTTQETGGIETTKGNLRAGVRLDQTVYGSPAMDGNGIGKRPGAMGALVSDGQP